MPSQPQFKRFTQQQRKAIKKVEHFQARHPHSDKKGTLLYAARYLAGQSNRGILRDDNTTSKKQVKTVKAFLALAQKHPRTAARTDVKGEGRTGYDTAGGKSKKIDKRLIKYEQAKRSQNAHITRKKIAKTIKRGDSPTF